MTTAALIVAAGRGTRAAQPGSLPKQYALLDGEPILARTCRHFLDHPAIDFVQVVIHPDDHDLYGRAMVHLGVGKLLSAVEGGASRQISVRNGLEALAASAPERVLIHDAARPFVTADIIDRVLAALAAGPGAIAALPVSDTLKQAAPDGRTIAGTVARGGLWRAQTPQGFDFRAILAAHRAASAGGLPEATDDAAVAERAGLRTVLVAGSAANIKITTAEDLAMASRPASAVETRVGSGFDVHRFGPGASVWLCGVEIPHSARLEGHSDADVALHALTDALLGAIGDGDIGQHFPPGDAKWKGAASHLFLADAARRVAAAGGRIVNVDVTILCEVPRIGPHREAMRARIAEILGIEVARVGVKATTTEGLGFTGRREGIAAMATASVEVG